MDEVKFLLTSASFTPFRLKSDRKPCLGEARLLGPAPWKVKSEAAGREARGGPPAGDHSLHLGFGSSEQPHPLPTTVHPGDPHGLGKGSALEPVP